MTEAERLEKLGQLQMLRARLPLILGPLAETVYADILSVALVEVVGKLACTAIQQNRKNISPRKLGEIYVKLTTAIQEAIGESVRENGLRVAGDEPSEEDSDET